MRQQNSRRLRLEAARKRIERGSLVAGQRILEGVGAGDPEVGALQRHAELSQEEAGEKLDEVERLLSAGQVSEAIKRFRRARTLDPQALRVAELGAKITRQVVGRVRDSLAAGHVERAADELNTLGEVGKHLAERREVTEIVGQAQRVMRALAGNRFEELRTEGLRLANGLPNVKWVQKASQQLRQLDELLLSVRSGPLGQPAGSDVGSTVPVTVDVAGESPAKPESMQETVMMGPPLVGGPLPERLLLLVDGGGSYLLHRGDRVSVGRAAASNPADVPIFSDLSERHADVARVDDDYFLFAAREVEVGGRRTRHQLLRNGDRVVLARRAKFTFRLPSRKSSSAVLEMSDSTRLPNDVRRVVLFRQTAMMGFGPSVHVSCGAADRGLLLFERAGRLWVRPQSRDGIETEARPIRIGEPIEMGGVSFVVRPWETHAPGTARI
jgi:hypothetical protein